MATLVQNNEIMADIVHTREQATKLFENIHNLLWNEAGFTPEKALNHMLLFVAYRMIEPQVAPLQLPRECVWSYLVTLPNEHALDEALRTGIKAFRRNPKTRPFFKPHAIRSSDIVRRLVEEIQKLDVDYLRDKDILGDVFEYMIGRGMSTMSDEGQYFTDRSICKLGCLLCFQVRANQLFRADGSLCTFCDPFCGTGGFVTEYVKKVTADAPRVDWGTMKHSVYAQDKSESAAKNTLLNQLILTGHLFDASHIKEGNSYQDPLVQGSNASFPDVSFDYMMMNPPYGGDKTKGKQYRFKYFKTVTGPNGKKQKVYSVNPEIQSIGIEDHDKVSAGVQLAMATLSNDGGVCAIVLPQGFFFGVTKKLVALRQKLAEEYRVHCIVDIDGGAFANTATKTAMMVFQKGVGATDTLRFLTLDQTPAAEATLDDLRASKYSFNYKQYVVQENLIGEENVVRLGDVMTICKEAYPTQHEQYVYMTLRSINHGAFQAPDPVPRAKLPGRAKYKCQVGDVLVGTVRPRLQNNILITPQIWKENLVVSNGFCVLRCDQDKILPRYLYNVLSLPSTVQYFVDRATGTTYPSINQTTINNFKLVLPPLEIQQELQANEVWEDLASREQDLVQKLEEQLMLEVKHLGRTAPIAPLGDLCTLQFGKRITKKKDKGTKYPVYGGGNASFKTNKCNRDGVTCKVGRFGISEANCVQILHGEYWLMDSGFTVQSNVDKATNAYIWYWLLKHPTQVFECGRATAQTNLDLTLFKKLQVPLPSLAAQHTLDPLFEEINHKRYKIAEYKAKARASAGCLEPGVNTK